MGLWPDRNASGQEKGLWTDGKALMQVSKDLGQIGKRREPWEGLRRGEQDKSQIERVRPNWKNRRQMVKRG